LYFNPSIQYEETLSPLYDKLSSKTRNFKKSQRQLRSYIERAAWQQLRQFSDGFSTWSTTNISTGRLRLSNLSP